MPKHPDIGLLAARQQAWGRLYERSDCAIRRIVIFSGTKRRKE